MIVNPRRNDGIFHLLFSLEFNFYLFYIHLYRLLCLQIRNIKQQQQQQELQQRQQNQQNQQGVVSTDDIQQGEVSSSKPTVLSNEIFGPLLLEVSLIYGILKKIKQKN